MKLRFKKIMILSWVIINIFSITAQEAHADLLGVALGNPIALKDMIMENLGINNSEVKNLMNTASVARKKINPPTVTLTFDPVDPVPGEKVTVTAIPTYFINTTENLYFTWYIKSKQCGDSANKDKCDLNKDGNVDIEDYKIKAARIIANNDFVWQPELDVYRTDTDNDGYVAAFGGDDQKGKNAYCFVHDVPSGDDYSIECKHLFPKKYYINNSGNVDIKRDGNGDPVTVGYSSNTFGADQEQFWHTNPNNKDTAGTGRTDEANIVGLGKNTISFTYAAGDKIGVAVEGVSVQPTDTKDSSYKTMWAFAKNTCAPTNKGEDQGYPKTTGPTTITYPDTNDTTPALGYTTKKTTTTVQAYAPNTSVVNETATIRTTTTTVTVVTHVDPGPPETTIIDFDNTSSPVITRTCSPGEVESGLSCAGTDADKKIDMTDMDAEDLNSCLEDNLISPAEGGGINQKLDVALKYLPENPVNDPSDELSENKNGDEVSFSATVSNPNNFSHLSYTWEVYAGDDITDLDNWKIVPKDILNGVGVTQTSGLGVANFKFKLNFRDADFATITATKKLPKYLRVKVTAREALAEGTGEREGHTDVTVPIFSSEKKIMVYTAKVNAENINFPAVKYKNGKYNEELANFERCLFEDPKTKIKTPSAICEVAKNELIGIGIDNGPENNPTYTDFLWTIDGIAQVCPSDEDSNPDNDPFSLCFDANGKTTDRTYFPILKEPGDSYNVALSALDTKTGERIDLTRVFKVSSPKVKIVPKFNPNNNTDKDNKDTSGKATCLGLILGKYQDFNGKFYDDRSDTKFQARSDSNIVLTPEFYGTDGPKVFDRPEDCPYRWNVDGVDINVTNATDYGYSIDLNNYGKLTLPPKLAGEKYLVSFSSIFTPTSATKKMLNKYWNVTYTGFYERKLTHNIEIEMVDANTELSKETSSPKKILASVSSGIPGYIAFLFRIVLSGMAIILALKIIFFVLPKTKFDEF